MLRPERHWTMSCMGLWASPMCIILEYSIMLQTTRKHGDEKIEIKNIWKISYSIYRIQFRFYSEWKKGHLCKEIKAQYDPIHILRYIILYYSVSCVEKLTLWEKKNILISKWEKLFSVWCSGFCFCYIKWTKVTTTI
jgi:hypothetical protein